MGYSRQEEEGRALAYIGSIFFSLGLAAFSAVMFSCSAFVNSINNRAATRWPTAPGRITTCDVKAIHGRFIDYAGGLVGYSYEIEDNYYSGYVLRQFWDEQRAWTFVDACKDTSVLVHYKVRNPQTSLLLDTEQSGALTVERRRFGPRRSRFGPVLTMLWGLRNVSDWAEARLQKVARNWPSVPGTVEYAEPAMVGEDRDLHWGGDLHYSYSVDGESFSDSYYFRAWSEEDAKELVEGWRNRKIVVHYFRGNPARSVFVPEEQDQPMPNSET
jgi:hypothetical protein